MNRAAIVVGGGPGGSVAALVLARAGWRVTLVEQHRFPRDKVCGECLSGLGAAVLRRLGLFDDVRARGAVRLGRTLLHSASGVCVDVKLTRPMWGVSRAALDGVLLDAAAGAGARLLQPVRCEAIDPGGEPGVRVRDLVTNAISGLKADVVMIADGKSALLCDGPPPPTGDLGIKTHFEYVDGPRDAIELFGLAGCYGGLAPIEGGRWNAALSVPAARVRRHGGNLAALFAEMLEGNVTLRRRLAAARQVGPWLAAPLPRFAVRERWPEGIIPLGNAAAAIEPIGGEGMGLAMRSAEVAAECLIARPSGGGETIAADYRRMWRPRRLACRGAALLASSPRGAEIVAPLLRAAPGILQPLMKLMHK